MARVHGKRGRAKGMNRKPQSTKPANLVTSDTPDSSVNPPNQDTGNHSYQQGSAEFVPPLNTTPAGSDKDVGECWNLRTDTISDKNIVSSTTNECNHSLEIKPDDCQAEISNQESDTNSEPGKLTTIQPKPSTNTQSTVTNDEHEDELNSSLEPAPLKLLPAQSSSLVQPSAESNYTDVDSSIPPIASGMQPALINMPLKSSLDDSTKLTRLENDSENLNRSDQSNLNIHSDQPNLTDHPDNTNELNLSDVQQSNHKSNDSGVNISSSPGQSKSMTPDTTDSHVVPHKKNPSQLQQNEPIMLAKDTQLDQVNPTTTVEPNLSKQPHVISSDQAKLPNQIELNLSESPIPCSQPEDPPLLNSTAKLGLYSDLNKTAPDVFVPSPDPPIRHQQLSQQPLHPSNIELTAANGNDSSNFPKNPNKVAKYKYDRKKSGFKAAIESIRDLFTSCFR